MRSRVGSPLARSLLVLSRNHAITTADLLSVPWFFSPPCWSGHGSNVAGRAGDMAGMWGEISLRVRAVYVAVFVTRRCHQCLDPLPGLRMDEVFCSAECHAVGWRVEESLPLA